MIERSGDLSNTPELTVLMPCLNEAETIEACITKALKYFRDYKISGEVLISDNGSTDGSQEIANRLGARIINVDIKGYGAALSAGIDAARGSFIVMGDSDDSYDFSDLSKFVEKLRSGYELVMGNRFLGGIAPGAMPFLHRYLGNPVLTFIGRLFFRCPCNDFHCGLRGLNRISIQRLNLRATGMEFASEMVVRATLNKLRITEVPTPLAKDGRSRAPHLRTWRDGWRHLRFLLLYSPRWLFLYPGLAAFILGALLMILLLPGPLYLFGMSFDVHTLLAAGTCMVFGAQLGVFSVLARQFASTSGLLPPDKNFNQLLRILSLERLLVIGGVLLLLSLTGVVLAIRMWQEDNYQSLNYRQAMRVLIPSASFFLIGLQIIFGAFFSSILDIGVKEQNKKMAGTD
jgi:glycosyltransferase involved in cell wall biosynthesis